MNDLIINFCEKCGIGILEEKLDGFYQINIRKNGRWYKVGIYKISERDAAYKKYRKEESRLGKGDDIELLVVFSEKVVSTEE